MYSSDEEDENLPSSVDSYYFEDDKEEPISFSVLPVQWARAEATNTSNDCPKIFLRGDVDNRLRKIYKPVVTWRFDLSNVKPQISVFTKEKNWIKLEAPRKSYAEMIRSVLVTVQCLQFASRNPESSGKSLWDQVAKSFSLFEVRPSEKDLLEHISLINEAVKRDDALSKSKFLAGFLDDKPGKRKPRDEEVKAKSIGQFIVSDSDTYEEEADEDEDDDDEMFDSACAFCDNGGDITCCEGSCLRSFHAIPDDESDCLTLGLTQEQLDATPQFLCKNCELKQHQCYICGKLGSSDKDSGAEVFRCVSATCGYFYHPYCVSRVIHSDDKTSVDELEKNISEGKSFTCPAHWCYVCKEGENKKDSNLQFAVCRRCPRAYHRKCLPNNISFSEGSDDETRAWENLLPNRILIYCRKHEIDKNLGTPRRDHIVFPGVEAKKSVLPKKKVVIIEEKKRLPKPTSNLLGDRMKIHRKRPLPSEPSLHERKVDMSKNSGKFGSGLTIPKKVKVKNDSKIVKKNKNSIGNRLYELTCKDSEPSEEDISDDEPKSSFELDDDSKKRLLNLIREADASVTMEDVKAKLKVPSTHRRKNNFDEKSITSGKVQATVHAVREALSQMEKGATKEEALVVCSEESLLKISRWRKRFREYLAPFFHGMRYTSFGRHFTKEEKLEEIAERLHWYVQPGDTVVDFCCGSNDFSIIMKKKLDAAGKKCFFKNYDIMPTTNDFNFERKDWMTVRPEDLPNGSKLIMGLNPPFGPANDFINKALEFKPKLLILIVPSEIEMLDKKETPYDLVWRVDTMLTGKSFYLPGSINVRDEKMEQWNNKPPPLYLWSRPDCTSDHKSIALSLGHIKTVHRDGDPTISPDRPASGPHGNGGDGGGSDRRTPTPENDGYAPPDAVEQDESDGYAPAKAMEEDEDGRNAERNEDGGGDSSSPPTSSRGSRGNFRRRQRGQEKRKNRRRSRSRTGRVNNGSGSWPVDHEPYVPGSPTQTRGPRYHEDEPPPPPPPYRSYHAPAAPADPYGRDYSRSHDHYRHDHHHRNPYNAVAPDPISSYRPPSYASPVYEQHSPLPQGSSMWARTEGSARSSMSMFESEPLMGLVGVERRYEMGPPWHGYPVPPPRQPPPAMDYGGGPPPRQPPPAMDYGGGRIGYYGGGGGWVDHPPPPPPGF